VGVLYGKVRKDVKNYWFWKWRRAATFRRENVTNQIISENEYKNTIRDGTGAKQLVWYGQLQRLVEAILRQRN
jgi:hypothetical protein